MKQINLTFLLAMLMNVWGVKAFAYDIEVVNEDGVAFYYNFINGNTELEITRKSYNSYFGSVVIPESVTYDGKTYNVTSIGDHAFQSSSTLISVVIPNSVTYIGNNAFVDCTNLKEVIIPNSVTFIGNSAFNGCTNLTEVTLSTSITSIESGLFRNCSSLKEVDIPYGVETIGDGAFAECASLASITIPSSVTYIGSNAFWYSSNLQSVYISDLDAWCKITFKGSSSNALEYADHFYINGKEVGNNLVIPNNVTSISSYAFFGYKNLKSITIGTGVLSIGSYAFGSAVSRAKIIWLPNTPPAGYGNAYGKVNYVPNEQYAIRSGKLTVYPFLSSMFEVDGVKYVPVSPSERTCDIIDCAYDDTAENISLNKTVTNMGITLSVEQIHAYAFSGNKYIKSVKISEGFSALNEGVFSGCSSLTSISIPNDINSIGDYVFEGCSSLRDVTFEDKASELWLGSNASSPMFADCPLNRVYIGRNISYGTHSNYGYSPFYRNTTLKTVIITDVETEIGENEFYGCTSLQDVTIGDGVTTIGDWAFSGCSSIDYFEYGSAVETIGKEAFSDCTAMTRLISHATAPPACGDHALDDINKWACTLYVPQGCAGAYQGADQWKDFFFISDDMAASIAPETIDVDTDDVKVYTIGGVGRTMKKDGLKSLPKGIYIVNGRKYIVK